MAKTLVGVFDDMTSAQSAVRDLQASGIGSSHIRLMNNADTDAATDGEGWADKVSDWFGSLFDDDADRMHAGEYAEAYRRGHVMVIADIDSTRMDSAIAVMNKYGTVDLTQRAELWAKQGWTGFDRTTKPYTAAQRKEELSTYKRGAVMPVVQEELTIGKRVVQRGGVRVHSYVEERAVEETVRLREEKIDVSRRAVNRPANAEDLAFKSRTVEVTAMGEDAVVSKTARVVEEVVVGKHVEQRDQTVQENLRRKDVRVQTVTPSGQKNLEGHR